MMKRFILIFLLNPVVFLAQEKCKIYCPIPAQELKKNKIIQIDIHRTPIDSGEKKLINTFYIDKKGCPYKEEYLPENVVNANRMKREFSKNKTGNETVFTMNEIIPGKNEKLYEKITETFDDKKKLIKRISEIYYTGLPEIKIESFDPSNPHHENTVLVKLSERDTLQIISTLKNDTKKIHSIRSKRSGMWIESERSITGYKNNEAVTYALYKNGMLIQSWEKPKEESKKIIEEENYNPLPVDERTAKKDTLYSSDGSINTATKIKSKKSFIVIHEYGEYAYRDKILTTWVYYPNGLPYIKHNTAEKTKLVYTYKQ